MNKCSWQIFNFDTVSSTNDEAKKYCIPQQKNVITTKAQTAGRGRLGRSWQSLCGNLFFSMAFEFALADLGALIIISSLSILEVIKKIQPKANVALKWPNDVLLNDCKVSGMLLEKGINNFMILGIGVNISAHPDNADMLYPTTSLAAADIEISAHEFLLAYLNKFDDNIQHFQQNGIDKLQKKWQLYAKGIGQKIAIQTPKQKITGVFAGIDANANLLLNVEGKIIKILAGDVFYVE